MNWNISLPPYDDHTKPHSGLTLPQLTLLIVWVSSVLAWVGRRFNVIRRVSSEVTSDVENGPSKRSNVVEVTLDDALGALVQLGWLMVYFYLCDYAKVLPKGDRVYNRDTFLFLVFLLFFMGIAFTLHPTDDKILNRDHTEEWKGWMQVMFVWYHYFAATEWYNWIRMYIACYVWMTGFGNFSFFWVRRDYSWWRFCKMLFRLDFSVLIICAVVSNEFMVYYICAMHTYWFLSVYLMMGILRTWNENRIKMALKFTAYAVCNILMFDFPRVADVFFRPFFPILGLAYKNNDVMHEWLYRIGLDHWVCFVGMLCAYNYPHFESFLRRVEETYTVRTFIGIQRGHVVKGAIAAASVAVYSCWHMRVLPLEKYDYNRLHPYTSFIPILVYIVMRNLYRTVRIRHIAMFGWLGKVTLETYLSQLHVYLQSNAKHLLVYIPGYPLLNFALATAIYLGISFRLFAVTNVLSGFFLPQDKVKTARNTVVVALTLTLAAVAASVLRFVHRPTTESSK